MAQTNINIRMDEELKKQFDAFCNEIGMSMTTAFCVFAKAAVKQKKIPFIISAESYAGAPNDETLNAIEEVKKMKLNTNEYKSYTDVDEMMKELLK